MKKFPILLLVLLVFSSFWACKQLGRTAAEPSPYVRVADGKFYIGDSVYRYVGTNLWYGSILGSTGRGGDRDRLAAELDLLQSIGVGNLRVLVGADGAEGQPNHIEPVLQTAPGQYNDTILDGLDWLMAELERRDMKAVLYLNNAWEWSGGYGTYLDWAGEGPTPNPAVDGYGAYMEAAAKFVHSDSARALAARHVANIVSRTNRYTGRPYAESQALMSWQIANEPRAFAADSATKAAFAGWIAEQAALIKSIDKNHMVSTGSEGRHGCEGDIDLWLAIHSNPDIDYGIVHMWPYNWAWISDSTVAEGVDTACMRAREYIMEHAALMRRQGKPLVVEEFGYPRDDMAIEAGSPTTGRDRFYEYVFALLGDSAGIAGCNFWGWGGYAEPAHRAWQPGDDYTGDPAQEAQGLNSVFAADSSTVALIRRATANL